MKNKWLKIIVPIVLASLLSVIFFRPAESSNLLLALFFPLVIAGVIFTFFTNGNTTNDSSQKTRSFFKSFLGRFLIFLGIFTIVMICMGIFLIWFFNQATLSGGL